jgi:putative endonuclease
VYIVRCADGTFYTGYSPDPAARTDTHNAGRGARYTAPRRPVTLVYAEGFRTKGRALQREYRLKQLSRAAKQALIESSRHPVAPIHTGVQGTTYQRRRHA